jgi:hypothetical protein
MEKIKMNKDLDNFDKIVETVYGEKRNRDDRPTEHWFEQITETKLYTPEYKKGKKNDK